MRLRPRDWYGARARMRLQRHLDVFVVIVLGCAALFVFALTNTGIDVDDAYISYRYMENLASHGEAVYNLGDRVYGSTAMLWVFVIALLSRITSASAEHTANIVAAVLTVCNAALSYTLVRHLGGSRSLAVVAAVALLSYPLFALVSTLGMETALLTALMLVCFLAFMREWPFRTGLLAALCFMTRPDALALICALSAVTAFGLFQSRTRTRARRDLFLLVFGFACLAAPFVAFCQAYYGTPLPNTLSAKRMIALVAAERWWMINHFLSGPGVPVSIALGFGASRLIAKRPPVGNGHAARVFGVAAIWLLAYITAWSWTGIDRYIWYVAAMSAPSVVALSASILLVERASRLPRLLVLAFLGVAVWWTREAIQTVHWWNTSYVEEQELRRRALGRAINIYAEPAREVVSTGAVGILGYECRECFIVDTLGLISPRARAAAYPRATLGYISAEHYVPDGFRAVYWNTSPNIRVPGVLLMTSTERPSTWDPQRVRPAIPLDLRFGSTARVLGVNPIHQTLQAGRFVQFEVLWNFEAPLPQGTVIGYYLSNPLHSVVASVDVRGFFDGRRSFQDVRVGETVLDTINLTIPPTTPPGTYELSTVVFPVEGFEVAGPTAAAMPAQGQLFTITVR